MAAKAAAKPAVKTSPRPASKPATAAKTTLRTDPLPAAIPTPPPAAVPYPQSPVLDMVPAVLVLVVNAALIPGLGTIIGAVVGKHKMIGRGVAQFFLTIVIVGWVWGIITGVQCLVNANRAKPTLN